MRTLNKNKQTLYYALYRESTPIYKLDSDGNKIVAYTDTTTNPPTVYYEELGQNKDGYYEPVEFHGSITLSGGDINNVEYGVSTENYEAILVTSHGEIPIDEKSLIWHETEPETDDDGYALESSADYRVIKVKSSLNSDKYILGKVIR